MKNSYRLYRRKGIYYVHDAETWDEYQKILAKEQNPERARYYEVLWQTGGAPVDIANLTEKNIMPGGKVLQFFRQKIDGQV